jgi:L-cysteine:1D-myo-inositol 2-amino-2-deoxy-alpha-D-glucopyranoside ligase
MKLYNTLTNSIEEFNPIDPSDVKMYVCGITPYDTTHLGHAFTYTVFDVLYRTLEFKGYKINYTQNVTDIDDDILKKAKQVRQDWRALGQYWTDLFVNDNKELNNIPPTNYVKATETIPTIIEIVEKLIDEGYGYEKNGNVYFRTQNDEEYGKLSKYAPEQMKKLSAERGADPKDKNKEHPLDFIMWQKSAQGEPSWDSPWGKGRPGWHIECSAMAYKYLDKKVDIHGGGSDLIYPHHESEIAQSEHFTGEKPFSQFWMHTGAVMYEGEKMSKSLGNLVMVSKLLKTYSPNAIRLMLLRHHYRTPWDFRQKDLDEAQRHIEDIEETVKIKPAFPGEEDMPMIKQFTEALENDLDTPKALAIIFELAQEQEAAPTLTNQQALQSMLNVLGFRV